MIKKIYKSKWFPRLFSVTSDGGKDSGVTAYFLIEWKKFFSIGILHFRKGSREAYHSHAFNALTWWLKGKVTEHKLNALFNALTNELLDRGSDFEKDYSASIIPKYTSKHNMHKVFAHTDTYALTLRGPWSDNWLEFKNNKAIVLTHGRRIIASILLLLLIGCNKQILTSRTSIPLKSIQYYSTDYVIYRFGKFPNRIKIIDSSGVYGFPDSIVINHLDWSKKK